MLKDNKHFVLAKIWDPVSRLWHWVFAITIIASWCLGNFMSFDTVRWHFYTGYVAIGLLAFRLLWGLVGPKPVRFASFWPTPKRVTQYLKGFLKREPSGAPGHNPLGALSVFAMLVVLILQAISGLFMESDDFWEQGPLRSIASAGVRKFMGFWHYNLPNIILLLIGLHILAILFYWLWKRENLIKPMISGWKWIRRQDKS